MAGSPSGSRVDSAGRDGHSRPWLPRPNLSVLRWGGLFAVLLAVAVLGALYYELEEDADLALERNMLLARMLEDHASLTIDAAALAAASLADVVALEGAVGSESQAAIRQTFESQSYLRALTILAQDGRVLASAGSVLAGGRVAMDQLKPLPAIGSQGLADYLPGRGLPLNDAADTRPAGLSALPYVRGLALSSGRVVYIVALINPNVFFNFQEQTLADLALSSALATPGGEVLAATSNVGLPVLQKVANLPSFTALVPPRDAGTWRGEGPEAGTRLVAFRALKKYPLVVVVEASLAQVSRASWQRLRWLVAGSASLLGGILLLTLVAARAQGARDAARMQLDAAQIALAARGRELDVVFASVRELLFRTDGEGAVQLMNARWESATGRLLADTLGRPLWDLVDVGSREQVKAQFEADPSSTPKFAEALIAGSSGHARHFELTVVALWEAGRLSGFAGSAVDVTELLGIQRQLQAQLAFTASVIESNPLPVVVLDTSNRYVRVNRAWEAFTGRSRDTVVGTMASLSHSPELARMHDERDRELMAAGGQTQYEAKAMRADGSLRDLYVSKALVGGADGQPAAIVGAFMDVSELREAERATAHARDLAEQASDAKSAFIANVSHELRTPLQAILGFAEIGLHRAQGQPRRAELFDDIHGAGQRMLALVNELLDLSRLTRPGMELQRQREDLAILLREVVAELSPLASAADIRLTVRAPAQPMWAWVDGLRLQQVMRNLLANAIRFSAAGAAVEVGSSPHGDGEVELWVADHGPGVPLDELEQIFEPFVQSSRTRETSGGTGLGLAIARRIARAHGGRISAANRLQGGAVFSVFLHTGLAPSGELLARED